MQSGSALAEYLRARRELVSPESAGIPHIGRRRVPGLRRDELSLLAGVSTDYYVRLEQGRDRNPSPQVLDALARALRLDDEATAHLHALTSPERHAHRFTQRPERVSSSIRQLIAGWHGARHSSWVADWPCSQPIPSPQPSHRGSHPVLTCCARPFG